MRGWSIAVPVTLGLAGFLFSTSAVTASGHDLRSDRRTAVTDLIIDRQQAIAVQQARLTKLRATMAAAGAGDPRTARLQAAAKAQAGPAGTVPVSGPAVTVKLDDAPHPQPGQTLPGSPSADDLVVHQQDVQAVVNALWAGGAEAMTIMNERVLSTTAVRCVGNTLLLHGRVYSPPFVVTAIGDQTRMGNALDAAPDVTIYRQYVAAYKLVYGVTRQTSVTLPGVKAAPELAYAKAGAR
ncbi:MAG: hypothetical protein QOF39_53 [Frankiales bacterium]|jgi:uncharacterized protein YlxW (UPF0749 family)|nr:hypothetical protein [Frankiales bacterium]